jgi:regulator of sigma E protease
MSQAFESVPLWMMILGFLLMLGPLVTLHELGHYLVGRWCGVKADVFSVGFGKEVAGYTDKRGTRWRLSALPLGGYVQFAGDMSPTSQPNEEWFKLPEWEREQAFNSKKLWQKSLIVAAGPVTNILIALVIFTAFFMAFGKPVAVDPAEENYIASFLEDSAAAEAGLQVGDRIAAIDGEPMMAFRDVQQKVWLYPDREMEITVERDGEVLNIPVTARSEVIEDRFGNSMTIGLIGVLTRGTEQRYVETGLFESVGLAGKECVRAVQLMVTGIGQIISGVRPVKELGGPISMAKFSGEQLSLGWREFVSFVAFISLNLAFINLLPIPVLDGGHLAFYAAEAIRRKPVSPRSQEWAFRTGMALVLGLMLFVTIIDIAKLPIFGS